MEQFKYQIIINKKHKYTFQLKEWIFPNCTEKIVGRNNSEHKTRIAQRNYFVLNDILQNHSPIRKITHHLIDDY